MKPIIDRFVIDVNDAIHKGRLPPKSKTPQHVPRMAATLLVFNYSMAQLLAGVPLTSPPVQTAKTTLERGLIVCSTSQESEGHTMSGDISMKHLKWLITPIPF